MEIRDSFFKAELSRIFSVFCIFYSMIPNNLICSVLGCVQRLYFLGFP